MNFTLTLGEEILVNEAGESIFSLVREFRGEKQFFTLKAVFTVDAGICRRERDSMLQYQKNAPAPVLYDYYEYSVEGSTGLIILFIMRVYDDPAEYFRFRPRDDAPSEDTAEEIRRLLVARQISEGAEKAKAAYDLTGEAVFGNLYAYAVYCLAKNGKAEAESSFEVLRSLIRTNNDTARCIYALSVLDSADSRSEEAENAMRLLFKAAENGCVIAQYYYGRFMFDGQMRVQRNSEKGLEMLTEAVNKGFAPALLYIRTRLEHGDSRFEISRSDIDSLSRTLGDFDKSKIGEAIVYAIR